jgi:hypothetical protein
MADPSNVDPGIGMPTRIDGRMSRRDLVRRGTKLAFVAPLLSSFLASEARAAHTNHSCYPVTHACPGAEPCCSGMCGGEMMCSN